ncbi:MAG: molybdopterin molybdenumtransferase MoeA, partial [Candidatus Binatia bacterium]
MISVEEAIRIILRQISPLPREEVPLIQAGGRLLCEKVRAHRNVPPFSNSAMDGYAVRWRDVAKTSVSDPVALRVVEDIPAGYVAKHRVARGNAIRIMTGAPIPRGADSIVRVEYTKSVGDQV